MPVIKPIRCIMEVLVEADTGRRGYFVRISNYNNNSFLFIFLIEQVAQAFESYSKHDTMTDMRNHFQQEQVINGGWRNTTSRVEYLNYEEITEFERFKAKLRSYMNETALHKSFTCVGKNIKELVDNRRIDINTYEIQSAHSTLGSW